MKKILIIEDDPAILLGLEELFKSENYDVFSVADGKEGLSAAFNLNPDIVILDVNLPGLNGFDVCKNLKANKFSNPIIMLTARTEQLDKVVGLEIGADDYITKPFNSRELLTRVRVQLRRFDKMDMDIKDKKHDQAYKRKLASIMFTDMKDYSKKMNLDEDRAINALKKHNEIMVSTVREFCGKIIETSGDGYLVSFESAVNAVECACLLQEKFRDYNKNLTDTEKIEIRIGVHLGDVLEFEDKLKGDTLNITARIQQNALPGKTHVSRSIFDAVKNKINYSFKSLGEQKFKNIREAVEIYEVIN